MKEIRFHGRGGQGAVTAAELLAVAAFADGKYSQAFPAFGVERRGAPVLAFTRIDEQKIRLRNQVYEPDYVIVLDATLIGTVDVVQGVKPNGTVLVNTDKPVEKLGLKTGAKVRVIDATKIALEELGRPIMNTTLLGAFAGATREIRLESIEKSVSHRFPGDLGTKNVKAVRRAYEAMEA